MNLSFLRFMPSFFWLEAASWIVAVLCLPVIRKTFLKWFALFLLFIVIVEIAGWYLPQMLHKHNAWIFNFSVPIEYLFYSYIYYNALEEKIFKKVIKIAGFLYLIFCSVWLLINGITIFRNTILTIGNLLAILYCCIYFFEVLKKEQVIDLRLEPLFWITCGVFLFNLGEFTYTLFRPVLTSNRWDVTLAIFKAINNKLIFWLYGCIIIGLLCTKLTKRLRTSG